MSDRDDETFIEDEEQWKETVVNDAVAGETVLPGARRRQRRSNGRRCP